MTECSYEPRCHEERALDFPFCPEHLATPRGRQVAFKVIESGALTRASDIQELVERQTLIVPDVDYQTSALEKMMEALDRVLEWEREARQSLDAIPVSERRYQDRTGSEQLRSEVGIYERALDKTSRLLSSMSKAALQEKMVTLGRAQVELMVRLLMNVIQELRLDNATQDKAKLLLLELLKSEANLVPVVEHHAQNELMPSSVVSIQGERQRRA